MKTEYLNSEPKTRVHLRAYKRVQKIHELIAARQYPNLKTLAGILEINERTVKRDINAFRESFNAPIRYDKTKKGYFYTHINWELPTLPFDDRELFSFFLTVLLLQAKAQTYQEIQLQRALVKIASRLPEEIFVSLSYLLENISFQSVPHSTVKAELLEEIALSATIKKSIEFDYFSQHRQTPTHRKVDVLLLHNFGGDWYVIAYDHLRNSIRDFHIGRITNLKETTETFKLPKGWNREEYLNRGFSMYRGGKIVHVEILFDTYQAQWIKERKYFHPQEQREILSDGSLRLSFEIGENGLEAVARFCLTYAGNFRAEKPEKLREIIKQKLEKALLHHS